MRSTRLTSLVLIAGLIVGGLVLDAADDEPTGDDIPAIEAGVAMPAATPAGTLASTWYCAGGTATDDGFADHVLLVANPTDQAKVATITVLTGRFAPPPTVRDTAAGGTTTTAAQPTTTTTEAATTTTEPVAEPPAPSEVELPPHSRVEVALRELVEAPLASAIVEVDGGEVAVEHQITSLEEGGGRATAPCSSTASRTWTFAWGVTERGARELLVFMNPFPDDATVTIDFATDEGTRQTLRFQNFVVPGRSVVGAFVDQDVTRKAQVSAHIQAGSGRVVVDRIQTFDGSNPESLAFEGITLGLGAPVPAEVWAFPDGIVDQGITEQIIVFNPTDEVAEVEAEVRLANPEGEVLPEPFEITVPPRRYSVVDLHEPDVEATEETPKRIPDGAEHSIIVRSLNHVPVVAERVLTKRGSSINVGVGAVLGSPLAARRWLLVAGGVNEERSEYATVLNARTDQEVTVSISRLADGRLEPIPDLQDVPVAAGARLSVRLRAYVDADVAPLVVTATGPVVVERGLYRFGGRGISFAMGIPVAEDVFVFDPLDG